LLTDAINAAPDADALAQIDITQGWTAWVEQLQFYYGLFARYASRCFA
jgi:hypothetical protein